MPNRPSSQAGGAGTTLPVGQQLVCDCVCDCDCDCHRKSKPHCTQPRRMEKTLRMQGWKCKQINLDGRPGTPDYQPILGLHFRADDFRQVEYGNRPFLLAVFLRDDGITRFPISATCIPYRVIFQPNGVSPSQKFCTSRAMEAFATTAQAKC